MCNFLPLQEAQDTVPSSSRQAWQGKSSPSQTWIGSGSFLFPSDFLQYTSHCPFHPGLTSGRPSLTQGHAVTQ